MIPAQLFYGPPSLADARRLYDRTCYRVEIHDPAFASLEGQEGNVTSQNGEDGVIGALFDVIGTRNKVCFEVGAADGFWCSNTYELRRQGWQSILIEADSRLFERLRGNNRFNSSLFCERIGPDSLDRILASAGAPRDLDLGVIDIDGEDVAIWQGLRTYRPRVVVIEFNPSGDGILGGTKTFQHGLETVAALGRAKGYRLVATTLFNAFFVDEGEL